jgi:hypothetical protein
MMTTMEHLKTLCDKSIILYIRMLHECTRSPDCLPSGFLPVQHSARSRPHSGLGSVGLLDRSAGSKTDPIEMTVIDRALCAVDLTG